METRINPQQVSHIQIYDAHKGYRWLNCNLEYTFRPKYKHWFWENQPQGYYRKGKPQSTWTSRFEELPEGCYDLLGELYSYAKIEIFAGEKRIKTEYFESIEQAKKYCNKNFKEVSVICKQN